MKLSSWMAAPLGVGSSVAMRRRVGISNSETRPGDVADRQDALVRAEVERGQGAVAVAAQHPDRGGALAAARPAGCRASAACRRARRPAGQQQRVVELALDQGVRPEPLGIGRERRVARLPRCASATTPATTASASRTATPASAPAARRRVALARGPAGGQERALGRVELGRRGRPPSRAPPRAGRRGRARPESRPPASQSRGGSIRWRCSRRPSRPPRASRAAAATRAAAPRARPRPPLRRS